MYVYVCICMYMYVYVCICMYICMYMYVCTYLHVCISERSKSVCAPCHLAFVEGLVGTTLFLASSVTPLQSHLGQNPRHGRQARLTNPSNSLSTNNSSRTAASLGLSVCFLTRTAQVCASSFWATLLMVSGATIQPPWQDCDETPDWVIVMQVPLPYIALFVVCGEFVVAVLLKMPLSLPPPMLE